MLTSENRQSIYRAIAELNRLSDLFHVRRAQLAAQVGLTEQQWLVLERVSDEHFMPSMFADERASSRAAVSKMIRGLIDKGLLSARVDQKDGRQRHYDLTERGRDLMGRLRALRNDAIEDVWADFDSKELTAFSDFCRALSSRITHYAGKEQG